MQKVEEKYKLSLLELQKRFVDLETLVNELQEKTKLVSKETLDQLREKMEELEDIVMASNLALLDTRRKLAEVKPEISEEQLKHLAAELQPRIQAELQRIEGLERKVERLGNSLGELSDQLRMVNISVEENVKKVEELRRDFESLQATDLRKLVTEVSALREEFAKEIRSTKEELEKLASRTSEIDIKLLASKFNSLKENVDYLLNRKVEFDMKLKSMEELLTRLSTERPEAFPEKVGESLRLLAKRLRLVEERMSSLEKITTSLKPLEPLPEYKELMEKIEQLTKKVEVLEKEIPAPEVSKLDVRITELLEKIIGLETRLLSLERWAGKAPVVLE